MSKVLLLGSKGWIGNQLLEILKNRPDVESVLESQVRADDLASLTTEVDSICPTHVISTIGRTHGTIDGITIPSIDYLEFPGKLQDNIRDNLFSPLVLAKLCNDRNIHFTYLGTGCIFEYTENEDAFCETAKPNFYGSSYSIVKGFTDQLMSLYSETVLNVRIRMPITAIPSPRDFITKIANYEKICSMPNSMTVLDELLPLMADMSLTKRVGTINLTNPGVITHSEVLEMYKAIIDPTKTWEEMSYAEQSSLLKSKRSNNMLNTDKLLSWYPGVSNIKTAVMNCLIKRKNIIT